MLLIIGFTSRTNRQPFFRFSPFELLYERKPLLSIYMNPFHVLGNVFEDFTKYIKNFSIILTQIDTNILSQDTKVFAVQKKVYNKFVDLIQ